MALVARRSVFTLDVYTRHFLYEIMSLYVIMKPKNTNFKDRAHSIRKIGYIRMVNMGSHYVFWSLFVKSNIGHSSGVRYFAIGTCSCIFFK